MAIDAVTIVRLGYLGATAAVILPYPFPSLRSRFLTYGARSTPATTTEQEKQSAATQQPKNATTSLLDRLAAIKVPHSYFTHFYIVCVALSLLWLLDYAFSRPLASRLLDPYVSPTRPTVPFHSILLTHLCVLFQGIRRLHESYTFSSPSSATMWSGHYAIGLLFYFTLTLSTFLEGLPTLRSHALTPHDFSIQPPSPRFLASLTLFALASGIQHDSHAYLHALKTLPFETLHPNLTHTSSPPSNTQSQYKLPQHPAFHRTLTPHYFAECLIYVALAFLAAPNGRVVNGTMVCAGVFVGGNLGVTAAGTRRWYEGKFGARALEGRARIVPFVF